MLMKLSKGMDTTVRRINIAPRTSVQAGMTPKIRTFKIFQFYLKININLLKIPVQNMPGQSGIVSLQ